jgi:competence protein ComFB
MHLGKWYQFYTGDAIIKLINYRGDKMELHNNMEDLVLRYAETSMNRMGSICKCEKCRKDVAAIALNNLPAKYIVTEKGDMYTRLKEMEMQYIADVVREVTKAIDIVAKNPMHE